jgi:hypothetical protein
MTLANRIIGDLLSALSGYMALLKQYNNRQYKELPAARNMLAQIEQKETVFYALLRYVDLEEGTTVDTLKDTTSKINSTEGTYKCAQYTKDIISRITVKD